jgi:hypothetical protein
VHGQPADQRGHEQRGGQEPARHQPGEGVGGQDGDQAAIAARGQLPGGEREQRQRGLRGHAGEVADAVERVRAERVADQGEQAQRAGEHQQHAAHPGELRRVEREQPRAQAHQGDRGEG